MELISIIVPVYNVQKYLNKCIESLVNQTYQNLEIILVDDGSPDNCPAMCDEWAEKDSRIKVIHKENGGLSDARNTGMMVAQGDYIGFVDGDDYINPLMYETLLNAMQKTQCDVASCEFQNFYEEESIKEPMSSDAYEIFTRKEAMKALIQNTVVRQVVWNKLYRREVMTDIAFPVGKFHEDEFWSYRVIGKANGVAITKYVGYNYLQRRESIMGVRYSPKRLDAIEAKKLRNQYVKENMPELLSEATVDLLFSCLYQGQMVLKNLSGKEKSETLMKLKQVYSQSKLENQIISNLGITHKIWLILGKYMFVKTCELRNLCKIGM